MGASSADGRGVGMTIRSGVGSGVVEDVPVRLNNRLSSSLDTDSPSSLSTPLSVYMVCCHEQ